MDKSRSAPPLPAPLLPASPDTDWREYLGRHIAPGQGDCQAMALAILHRCGDPAPRPAARDAHPVLRRPAEH